MARTTNSSSLVQIGSRHGHPVIDPASPLTRLNYFDGKFLRAPDLQAEQAALLAQVHIANQAGGGGVVHGFDCSLSAGDALNISSGLAIDLQGRPLLMPQAIDIDIDALIAASQRVLPSTSLRRDGRLNVGFEDCTISATPLGDDSVVTGAAYYLIVLNHIEAHCGEEDVYGKLCSEACISSTARSHIIEGVEIQAIPISLSLKQSSAVPFDNRHLRSRAASAFFEKERLAIASLISGPGMRSDIWCLGANPLTGQGIAIGLIGRSGTTTLFLDAWATRRERIDAPPQQYWAARMAMRSLRVYFAQINQFQCQLRSCLARDPAAPVPGDPCADERALLKETATDMEALVRFYALAADQLPQLVGVPTIDTQLLDVARLERSINALRLAGLRPASDQILIDCGIVELPSAGYLPVAPSSNLTVNEQVQRLLGDGVDLRFCVVRPDFVQHALEEAQHMQRICLTTGLDDPSRKQAVDILVPDGQIERVEQQVTGTGFRSRISLSTTALLIGWQDKGNSGLASSVSSDASFGRASVKDTASAKAGGAARSADATNGQEFYLAAETAGLSSNGGASVGLSGLGPRVALGANRSKGATIENIAESFFDGQRLNKATANLGLNLAMWVELRAGKDPFSANAGERIDVHAKVNAVVKATRGTLVEQRTINGVLSIEKNIPVTGGTEVSGRLQAQGLWQEERILDTNSEDRTQTIAFNDDVIMRRDSVNGLPRVSLTVVNPSLFAGLDNIHLVFEQVQVSATEQKFRGFVRRQSANSLGNATNLSQFQRPDDIELMSGSLTEDDTALTPGSNPHTASLSAIGDIAVAIRSSTFTDTASSALFPPRTPVADELKIIARHPWVLFHRRRDKTCGQLAATAAIQPARSYQVFHVHVEEQTTTDELVAAIEADFGAVIGSLPVTSVGTIEFGSGVQTVTTPHTDVRRSWRSTVQVDADVHAAVIASQGDVLDEGLALATARLQSLTNVLAAVSQSAPDLQLLTTANVPPGLTSAELDGVIVYFTKAVATVCHKVFRLLADDQDASAILERISEILQSGGDITQLELNGTVLSATPRFIDGSDNYFTPNDRAQLVAEWNLIGDGPVSDAMCISSETGDGQLIARQQTGQLVEAVGGDLTTDEILHETTQADLFQPCTLGTILLSRTQCNNVLVFTPRSDDLDALVQALVDLIRADGLPQSLFDSTGDGSTVGTSLNNPTLQELGIVDFFARTGQFEATSRDAFNADWISQLGSNSPADITAAYIAVGRAGATDEETAANRDVMFDQGESLRSLMGLSAPAVTTAVINNPDATFPVDCPGLTLVVVPTQGLRSSGVRVITRVDSGDSNQPAFSASKADTLSFDSNNKLVRDTAFNSAVARFATANEAVSSIEIVAIDGKSNPKMRARANAVLKALKASGAASDDAQIVVRKPNTRERVEILRSGLDLDNAVVLRRK